MMAARWRFIEIQIVKLDLNIQEQSTTSIWDALSEMTYQYLQMKKKLLKSCCLDKMEVF